MNSQNPATAAGRSATTAVNVGQITSTLPRHMRCRDGAACEEVVARVAAADVARRQGCTEHAEQLLATARRIAGVHDWGNATGRDVDGEAQD